MTSATEFFEALTSTAAACAELDTFDPLAHLIDGWRATAEIHANPTARGPAGRPSILGSRREVKRPKAT